MISGLCEDQASRGGWSVCLPPTDLPLSPHQVPKCDTPWPHGPIHLPPVHTDRLLRPSWLQHSLTVSMSFAATDCGKVTLEGLAGLPGAGGTFYVPQCEGAQPARENQSVC